MNRVCLVLALGGVFVAGVLSLGYLLDVNVPCGGSSGCETVAKHPASKFAGIPVAYFGLLAYLMLAVLAVVRIVRPAFSPAAVAGFLITIGGALISLGLMYVSVYQIHATCRWCQASAGIMMLSLLAHALLNSSREQGTIKPPLDWGIASAAALASLGGIGYQAAELVKQKNVDVPTPSYALEKKVEDFIPEGAQYLGKPDAPVVVVEFGDLLCPHCKASYFYFKDLVRETDGKIQFVFRHFALIGTPGHEHSAMAALVSELAAEKGQFWPYVDAVFSMEKEQINPDVLMGLAVRMKMDPAKVYERINNTSDPSFLRFYGDREEADKLGLTGTPSFLMGLRGQAPELEGLNTYKVALNAEKYKKALGR